MMWLMAPGWAALPVLQLPGVRARLAQGLQGLSRELGEVRPCGSTGSESYPGPASLLDPGAGQWGWAGDYLFLSPVPGALGARRG